MVKIFKEFSKIEPNNMVFVARERWEKKMLARRAISSFGKGMFTMFTRVSSWRISMLRHVAIGL